jgi:phosphate transport system protein
VAQDNDLRARFHAELAEVDQRLSDLVHFVADEVSDATDALLREDAEAAVEIESRTHLADPLYEEVERKVAALMARQGPMASDLQYLLAVLRAVPEVEQSADLADDIAARGSQGIASALSGRARALLTRMGDVATAMWRELNRRWDEREQSSQDLIEAAQSELDDLHTSLTAEVAATPMPASVLMEMALIGRFYERLGDHAVAIAGRLDRLTNWPLPGAGAKMPS